MTTLVRTRNPLDTLSMNSAPQQRRRSKRLATYDESDGDFNFTRGSKRAKASTSLQAVAEAEPTPPPPRSRKAAKQEQDEAPKEAVRKPTRRKMSFSTPHKPGPKPAAPKKDDRSGRGKGKEAEPAAPQEPRRTRRVTRSSLEQAPEADDDDAVEMIGMTSSTHTPRPKTPRKRTPSPPPREPEGAEITRTPIHHDSSHATSTIALPFSDTPIITRNKALRETTAKRRSSLGLRGRRASSLIDHGHRATPHAAVPPDEFYKHIEAEGLSEPRRMKQLLTWCGERALGAKPAMGGAGGEGGAAVLAARHIQEQLLAEFASRSDRSDWFSREPTRRRVVTVPNPLNVGNAARVAELEARIKGLRLQRSQFHALAKPPPPPPPPPPSAGPLDASLLDAESAAILARLTLTSASLLPSIEARLQTARAGLEFQTDVFAHGVHALEQARAEMEDVAGRVSEACAGRLEAREERERGGGGVPVQDVLRALGRVMPGGRR